MKNSKNLNGDSSSDGKGFVFGVGPVLELQRSGNRRIEKILIAEGKRHKRVEEIIGLAKTEGTRFQFVQRRIISDALDPDVNHQGVMAVCSQADYYDADKLLTELRDADNALCLILDGIEDPRNLGAILRSAECAGVDGVFIPDRRAAGLNQTVAKTSAGAVEFVKVARVKNINRLIDDLKEAGVWVVGTNADSDTEYTAWDWRQKCALVLGSEGTGIRRLTEKKCDVLVRIPMYGKIGSLNVSVAAGVVLFEVRRQRSLP